jgi:hypothetical protein
LLVIADERTLKPVRDSVLYREASRRDHERCVEMAIVIAVFVLVGALIISFAIPPHHLFRTGRAARQRPDDPRIPAGNEEMQ